MDLCDLGLFWYQKQQYTCFFEKGHAKDPKKRPLPGRPEESWPIFLKRDMPKIQKKRPLPGRPEESWPNWFLPQNPTSPQIEFWIARIEATHPINPPATFFFHFFFVVWFLYICKTTQIKRPPFKGPKWINKVAGGLIGCVASILAIQKSIWWLCGFLVKPARRRHLGSA